MGFLKNLDIKSYFIICAVVFVLIALRSLRMGRLAGAEHRRKGFWIAAFVIFIGFIIGKAGIIGDQMREYSFVSGDNVVYYGKAADEAVSLVKTVYAKGGELPFDDNDGGIYDDPDIDRAQIDDFLENAGISDENDDDDGYIKLILTDMKEVPDSWKQIKPAGVKASNSLKKYPPQMLTDGDISTSWQVSVEKPDEYNSNDDLNEWLYFGFGAKTRIDYIVIYNGTPDSEKRFYKNGRAEDVTVSDLTVNPQDRGQFLWSEPATLADDPSCQIIECRNLNASELYLVINTMYPGSAYTELCITDVMFYSAE